MSPRRSVELCLALVVLSCGCHRPDDYLLAPGNLDRALDVTLSAMSLPADGVSRLTITAQLDPRTDADKRSVTFTTNAGAIVAGGKEGSSVVVQADNTGKAVAELRSSTVPGTAGLEVTAGPVLRMASVAFVVVARADLFDASVSRTSVPADGFSRTVITATLKRLGTLQQRAVKFETSAGLLIASGQESPHVVTLTADSTGKAEVELQSEKTPGTARVRVTTLEIPHEFSITFTPVDPAQIITLATERSSAPADGVTPLGVSASVAAGLPSGRRSVTFRSTLGQAIPTTAEADGSNIARTNLISTTTGVAHISATVDGTTAETTAEFTVAHPDRLHVALDAAELKSGGSTTVRVTLTRTTGSVSPHLRMSYSAKTNTGASIGTFSAITLAENGVATATFNVGTTSYLGPVTITAAEGDERASATLKIVP
jgi:hypothetical protein